MNATHLFGLYALLGLLPVWAIVSMMGTTCANLSLEAQHVERNCSVWRLFWKNWRRCTLGSIRFLFAHPILAPRILWTRFVFTWRDMEHVLKVPEKFTLRWDGQLLSYFQIFICKNLYHKAYIKPLRDCFGFSNPTIVDVGANAGLFTQWISQFNPQAHYISFEPNVAFYQSHLRVLQESPLECNLQNVAVGTINDYTHNQVALDAILDRKPIFLLKIDTDGSNLDVLEGAKETLRVTRFVLIEKESNYEKFFKNWKCIDLGADLLYEQPFVS